MLPMFGMLKQRRLLATLALAALTTSSPAQQTQKESLKIGLLLIDGGAFSVYTESTATEAKVAADYFNSRGGANGQKFEIVEFRHPMTPAGALQAATRAVQSSGAHLLIGGGISSLALALSAKADSLNALIFDPSAQGDDLTGKNCVANYFRTAPSDTMYVSSTKDLITANGVRSWSVIAGDFAGGRSSAKAFQDLVSKAGGQIKTVTYAPPGTADFAPYIQQLKAAQADALFVSALVGADSINFARQQEAFGLLRQHKVILGSVFTNDVILEAQGDAVLGVYQTLQYHVDLPGQMNADFVRMYRERMPGKSPTTGTIFAAFAMIKAAADKAKSTDMGSIRKALVGLKVETNLGLAWFRAEDGQMVRPVMVAQVEKLKNGSNGLVLKDVKSGDSVLPPVNPECKRGTPS